MKDRISVHIANKDRATELAILLHSLKNQTFQSFDVIVLNDASGTDPMGIKFVQDIVQRLRLDGHGVKFLNNKNSFGVCKARNKLLDEDPWKDNTNFVLRLDDDVILEPNYIERLMYLMKEPICDDELLKDKRRVGIASGVTPLLSGPDFKREIKFVFPIINKIELDAEGNIVKYADDCGYLYTDACKYDSEHGYSYDVINHNYDFSWIKAHQFRSNALIRREIIDKGLRYELGLTNVGFREEAFFSLRVLMMGYKILVGTEAIAWHAPANSGGCRYPQYPLMVQSDEQIFRQWVKNNKDKLKEVLI